MGSRNEAWKANQKPDCLTINEGDIGVFTIDILTFATTSPTVRFGVWAGKA